MHNNLGTFISSDNEAGYEINQNKLKSCNKSKLLHGENVKNKTRSLTYIQNELGDENNG